MGEIYKAEFLQANFSPPMGTPVEEWIVFCLTNRVPPESDGLGNEHRFGCLYHAGEESYEIQDQHLMLQTYLLVALAKYTSDTQWRHCQWTWRCSHLSAGEQHYQQQCWFGCEWLGLTKWMWCFIALCQVECGWSEKEQIHSITALSYGGHCSCWWTTSEGADWHRFTGRLYVINACRTASCSAYHWRNHWSSSWWSKGSRSKINFGTKVWFQYKGVDYVQAKTCWKCTKCCWAAQIWSRLESSVSNWRVETLDSTGYVHFWVNKCKQQVKETSQGRI